MRTIRNWFFQGLLALLPIVLTIAVVYWLGASAEATLGQVIAYVLPYGWYMPGMGVVFAVLAIIAVGMVVNAYLFREMDKFVGTFFSKIPLVEIIYTSFRDIARFAAATQKDTELQTAVLVTLSDDIRLIGFITDPSVNLPGNLGDDKICAVYLPMSYQIGGYTLFVPESRLQMLDMTVQEAMRYVVTAGMTHRSREEKS